MVKISKECISCLKLISDKIKPSNYCFNCHNKNSIMMINIKKTVKEILEANC